MRVKQLQHSGRSLVYRVLVALVHAVERYLGGLADKVKVPTSVMLEAQKVEEKAKPNRTLPPRTDGGAALEKRAIAKSYTARLAATVDPEEIKAIMAEVGADPEIAAMVAAANKAPRSHQLVG